jgi:hypothetical protein
MLWRRKPTYVEWDLVGTESSGLGADIYPSAAPMVIIHQIDHVHRTYGDVATAVEQWVGSMSEKYRLNAEFEEFKAIARRIGDGDSPGLN